MDRIHLSICCTDHYWCACVSHEELVGMWGWKQYLGVILVLVFRVDGTGFELHSSLDRFAWTIENGYLIMEGAINGYFTYTIDDDILTLIGAGNGNASEFYRLD